MMLRGDRGERYRPMMTTFGVVHVKVSRRLGGRASVRCDHRTQAEAIVCAIVMLEADHRPCAKCRSPLSAHVSGFDPQKRCQGARAVTTTDGALRVQAA